MLKRLQPFLLLAAIVLSLYLASTYSYLLFHAAAEGFAITVAFSIFLLALNTRRWMEYDYFLFLGISVLFVAIIDAVHMLAYKGMNIFAGYDANLPTQLWILGRYMQSVSLLLAPVWLKRRLHLKLVLVTYFIVSAIFVFLIFTNHFPPCYIEGVGLTPFKIQSEYIAICILAASYVPLFLNRSNLEPEVLRTLSWFISLTAAAELAFTAYFGVYDGANFLGHILRIYAYIFLYNGLLKTGLQKPFDLIFRDLKLKGERLRHSQAELQRLFEINPFPVLITTQTDGRILKTNQAALDLFEIDAHNIQAFRGSDFYVDNKEREVIIQKIRQLGKVQNELLELKKRSGIPIWCLVNVTPIEFQGEACLLTGMADVTKQKQIQEELHYQSNHDALTGLYNRHYFEIELERLQSGRRFPVSVIVMDFDNLKVINDTYGHSQGDAVLKTFARLVRSILRADEVFARTGGDEFSILLPATDEAQAERVVDDIRQQCESCTVENTPHRIGVSIGVGVATETVGLNKALYLADTYMYEEKRGKKVKER